MREISIVGIGKLGLCFALTLEKFGYNVLGVDVSNEYVSSINEKTLKSSEPGVEEHLLRSKNFTATTSLRKAVEYSDALFIVVATPSLPSGRYDHTQVERVIDQLEKIGKQESRKHFIVCCTVMPGYCDSIRERLDRLNFSVSYNPEFIAQGTILRDQESPDMVLIGQADQAAGEMIESIYRNSTKSNPRICRMSPTEAEITKISLNCFLTTKIAFANMVGDIVTKSGGNPDSVLSAIGSDSRIGQKYLKYGFGYGGPCFPRDNRALGIYAEDINMPALIGNATDRSNDLHLNYQISEFARNNDLRNEIQIDCVTYKPDSTMLVESQQLKFAVGLANLGYKVVINERSEVIEQLKESYPGKFTYKVRV